MQPSRRIFTSGVRFLVQQLRALAEESLDGTLGELLTKVMAYPKVRALSDRTRDVAVDHRILLPVELRIGGKQVSLFTTLVRFDSAQDVTLSELLVELFYPLDQPQPGD